METIREVIAKNLRFYRLKKGFSQEKLAVRADLTSEFISLIERGKCNVGADALARMAKALEVNAWELLKE